MCKVSFQYKNWSKFKSIYKEISGLIIFPWSTLACQPKSIFIVPLINVRLSSSEISEIGSFMKKLSSELASLTGKPEKYVMTPIQANVPMTFGGSEEPCCYVEVKSIGSLKPSEMTKSICNLIQAYTGIDANRIYINFEDISPSLWGFNGQTFG